MSKTARRLPLPPRPRNLMALELTRNGLFRSRACKSRDAIERHADPHDRKGKHRKPVDLHAE
jgi:hypothetical protein